MTETAKEAARKARKALKDAALAAWQVEIAPWKARKAAEDAARAVWKSQAGKIWAVWEVEAEKAQKAEKAAHEAAVAAEVAWADFSVAREAAVAVREAAGKKAQEIWKILQAA